MIKNLINHVVSICGSNGVAMRMNRVHGNKRGYLLPMVTIYMIIAMIVGSGIMVLGSMDRIEANNRLHREQAFYLAEAGINYARFQLNADSSWVPSPNPMTINLGAGSFRINETITGDTVVITSTGTVGSTKSVPVQMTLVVDKTIDQYFSTAIFASEFAELKSGRDGFANVYGNVGSNLKVKLEDKDCHIYGNASVANGGVIEQNGGLITGSKIYNAAKRTLAAADVPDELSAMLFTKQNDPKISGSYTLDNNGNMNIADHNTVTFAGGDYKLRDFTLNHDDYLVIAGDARILINHKIVFDNGNLVINPGSTLLLYIGDEGLDLDGDIDAKNTSMLNAGGVPLQLRVYAYGEKKKHIFDNSTVKGLFYAPLRKEQIEIKNHTNFYGAIVCMKFKIEKANVYESLPVTQDVQFISWTKPNWKR